VKGAYYNEFNPESAAMIRQMMVDGLIPHGDVDTRSITEVSPDDLKPYTQCHFFAGIAGWTYALQLAGWPADRPVWTGSAPCQPFSSAGKQKGKDDERHLFPTWLGLIRECRPATIFGEQVASAVAHGWLDDVYQGLEAEGYAVGAAVLPACSVGAPHRRDRLWFVAHAECQRWERGKGSPQGNVTDRENAGRQQSDGQPWGGSEAGGHVAHAGGQRRQQIAGSTHGDEGQNEGGSSHHNYQLTGYGQDDVNVADTERLGQPGQGKVGESLHPEASCDGQANQPEHVGTGVWDAGQWVACPDGKARLIEPSIPLLADGVQHRRPILHAIGNAIVPQVGAAFIEACGVMG
jgi:DNA (cytosine-5)-methyltransferase 1